jgi:hypothetical protein
MCALYAEQKPSWLSLISSYYYTAPTCSLHGSQKNIPSDISIFVLWAFSCFNCDQRYDCVWLLYAFFWVIPQRLNFICRRFGILRLFHLHAQIGVEWLCLRNVRIFRGKKGQSFLSPMSTPRFLNPFQSKFSANRILLSSYLFWAVKRLVDYL